MSDDLPRTVRTQDELEATLRQPEETVVGTPRRLNRKLKNQQILSAQRLKKLRAVRQRNRRLQKKIATLEKILEDLKTQNMINEEDSDLLQSIDPMNKDFLKRMLKIPSSRKYSPFLRKFALCLQYISPRAYKYVREQFNTCLPHPKTLCSWYKCVDGEPGFTNESLDCLKLLVSRSLFGSLADYLFGIKHG